MKILFLDFDGVLNSEQFSIMFHRQYKAGERPRKRRLSHSDRSDELCPIAISNLNYIMECCPDVRIVVASTWRGGETVDSLGEILSSGGFKYPERVIGLTPHLHEKERGHEIQAWLDNNQNLTIDDFVILDDEDDMVHLTEKHLIQTDFQEGLMLKLTKEIIDRFNGSYTGTFI